MSIVALIMYGSVARGDDVDVSDLDLLAVVTGKIARKFDRKKTNIIFNSESNLIYSAQSGELFAFHILSEGKFVYDSEQFESRFRANFKKKTSYTDEIVQASALGWLLYQRSNSDNHARLLNRRAAWCLRTILIAKSVELGFPRFSVGSISELFPLPEVHRILTFKDSNQFNLSFRSDLRASLIKYGDTDTIFLKDADISEQMRFFRKTSNKLALRTLFDLEISIDELY